MTEPLWVIIPAAGVGRRMGAACPKQYLSLAGQTILDRTISIFIDHPMIAGIAVGISPEDQYWPDSIWNTHPKVKIYQGGKERSDTVKKGLIYLQKQYSLKEQHVLVHDAARPLLSQPALERILFHQGKNGALLALPSRDTVKQQNETGQVMLTHDRRSIWLAQTPQKFPLSVLLQALSFALDKDIEITDESSAMEYSGWHPDLVIGEACNLKVTLPDDLIMAEALLIHRNSKKNQEESL